MGETLSADDLHVIRDRHRAPRDEPDRCGYCIDLVPDAPPHQPLQWHVAHAWPCDVARLLDHMDSLAAQLAAAEERNRIYAENAQTSTSIVARQTLELSELRRQLAAAEGENRQLREVLQGILDANARPVGAGQTWIGGLLDAVDHAAAVLVAWPAAQREGGVRWGRR